MTAAKKRPYPIPARILGFEKPVDARVVKLTNFGFLIEVPQDVPLTVHEKRSVELMLPMSEDVIAARAVIVKVYNQYVGKTMENAKIYRLMEMHFETITPEHKLRIERFIRLVHGSGKS